MFAGQGQRPDGAHDSTVILAVPISTSIEFVRVKLRKPKKPARRQPPAWEVYRSPAAFVRLVYAKDEETALA